MPFDNIVSRTDAAATIPEDVAAEVVKAAAQQSAALALFRRVNMGTKVSTLPVVSALAQAYFVAGDTGLKQTTEMAWAGVTLEAEEIAAIVPVPEAVVADSEIDMWSEIQEGLAEAVGQTLDAAVFSGTNKPASWATAIVPAATTAGNTTAAGTAAPEEGGIIGDIDTVLDLVVADGFTATGLAASPRCAGSCAAPATPPGSGWPTWPPGRSRACPWSTSAAGRSPPPRSPSAATSAWPCSGCAAT